MSRRMRSYWFELSAVALGLGLGAAMLSHGREAVFSVGMLTAAALSASVLVGRASTGLREPAQSRTRA